MKSEKLEVCLLPITSSRPFSKVEKGDCVYQLSVIAILVTPQIEHHVVKSKRQNRNISHPSPFWRWNEGEVNCVQMRLEQRTCTLTHR
jgi:hypothetical protein